MREPDRIIRMKTVQARTGLSKSTIYRKMAEGTFPAQLKISTNGSGCMSPRSIAGSLTPPAGEHEAISIPSKIELAKQVLPRRRKSRYFHFTT